MFYQFSVVGGMDENVERYMIYVDKVCVMQVATYADALKVLLATFFIFNIMYPRETANSLQFFQR